MALTKIRALIWTSNSRTYSYDMDTCKKKFQYMVTTMLAIGSDVLLLLLVCPIPLLQWACRSDGLHSGRLTWNVRRAPWKSGHCSGSMLGFPESIWWWTERSVSGNLYIRTTIMDREGFAKVSRWCRESNCFSRKFNITQLLYYGCHHTWRMLEIQECNVTFCDSFAKAPRELRESRGWDLKGGALSFSQLLHFHTYSLSLSHSHSLSLSPHFVTLSQSLSSSLPRSPSLSLSPTLSLLLSVCLYLSLSLSLYLFLLLDELVIRISTAMVPRTFREK